MSYTRSPSLMVWCPTDIVDSIWLKIHNLKKLNFFVTAYTKNGMLHDFKIIACIYPMVSIIFPCELHIPMSVIHFGLPLMPISP